MKAAVTAAALLFAAGAKAHTTCPTGLHSVTTAELFFGLDDRGAAVGEAEWKAFVDWEVTPRFPDGLTVWDGAGQWRSADGALTREPSKVMMIVLTGRRGERAGLAAVVSAYKTRFRQRSVLLTEHRDCASF